MSENEIREYGVLYSDKLVFISIIGEIEGHELAADTQKTTKYEHLLPILAGIENDEKPEGVVFIINTTGGDISAGLAIAEMIAGMEKKTVSLVIGDSHSIGGPIAVAADYSFIAPTASMIIHPVRMGGNVLGTRQTVKQMEMLQDRILSFIAEHSKCSKAELEKMMKDTSMIADDLGTILVGENAVKKGVIDEVGGISQAIRKISNGCKQI